MFESCVRIQQICNGFDDNMLSRSLWSRVLAVKLFLEHVCSKATEEKADKIPVKHCMPLFLVSMAFRSCLKLGGGGTWGWGC